MPLQQSLIAVDSSFRDKLLFPCPTDFRVYFPTPLTDMYKVEFVNACLSNISFNVTEVNQSFGWEEQSMGSISAYTVKVPTGHYS